MLGHSIDWKSTDSAEGALVGVRADLGGATAPFLAKGLPVTTTNVQSKLYGPQITRNRRESSRILIRTSEELLCLISQALYERDSVYRTLIVRWPTQNENQGI